MLVRVIVIVVAYGMQCGRSILLESVAQHTFAALETLHKNNYYHHYVQSGQYSESGMFELYWAYTFL